MSEETKYPGWAEYETDERRRLVASIIGNMDSIAKVNGARCTVFQNAFNMSDRVEQIRIAARYPSSDGRSFDASTEFCIREYFKIAMEGPAGKTYEQEGRVSVTNKRSYPNGQLHATVTFGCADGYVCHSITRGGGGRRGRSPTTRKYDVVCQKLVGKNQDLGNLFGCGGVSATVREVCEGMTKKLRTDSSADSVAERMRAVLGVDAPIAFDGTGADATFTVDYGYLEDAKKGDYYAKYRMSLGFRFKEDGRLCLRNFDSYQTFTEDEFVRIAAVVREAMERRHAEEIIKGL